MSFVVARYKCCKKIVSACASEHVDDETTQEFKEYEEKGLLIEKVDQMYDGDMGVCRCVRIPEAELGLLRTENAGLHRIIDIMHAAQTGDLKMAEAVFEPEKFFETFRRSMTRHLAAEAALILRDNPAKNFMSLDLDFPDKDGARLPITLVVQRRGSEFATPAIALKILQERIAKLRQVLELCGKRFSEYAAHHLASGKTEKYEANQDMAEIISAVLKQPDDER